MNVTEAQTTEDFVKWYDLRWQVLRKAWKQPQLNWQDEHEKNCTYAIIWDDNKNALAVCRLHFNTATEAQIRYMAVRDDQQGKGLGKLLLGYLENKAKQQGAQKVVLQSREKAVDFYKKNGYTLIEKTHLLWGEIQHYLMEKKLQ